jgi:hypothetical protein
MQEIPGLNQDVLDQVAQGQHFLFELLQFLCYA